MIAPNNPPTFPGGLNRGAIPDGWLPKDRKAITRLGVAPEQIDHGDISVRQLIARSVSWARKGDPYVVACVVAAFRKVWHLSDFALCEMFWDCARVQGTELRAWLEEVERL